ncbi:MAG: hypothetical protein CMH83_11245 [Nocardioides sp.]|nr:hypothetical protein [Nocardioides sp.]
MALVRGPERDPWDDPALLDDGAVGAGDGTGAVERRPDAVVDTLPGLARVAAGAAWHTADWSARTSIRSWARVARALTDGDEAAALVRDAGRAADVVSALARAVSDGRPVADALVEAGRSLGSIAEHPSEAVVDGQVVHERVRQPSLRERGQDLLEASRDVWRQDVSHPAYERILDDLAPDEARVLVLLAEKGPQPSVDVRTGGPIGMVSSQLVAPGLTMIGARAGARYPEKVPSYLNNLFRLGLVWFSTESLKDPMEYQVLEAQPDVLAAMHSVTFAKVVRRSIHLTPFGEDFCRLVLLPEEVAEAPLPEHATPNDGDALEPPRA